MAVCAPPEVYLVKRDADVDALVGAKETLSGAPSSATPSR